MDNNKKNTIEQDAQELIKILSSYSAEEKIVLSRILNKETGVSLNVYNNPTMVAVALVPVVDNYQVKLLGVRRGIMPFVGELAFSGGFAEKMETAAMAAARETQEETGIILDPKLFKVIDEKITPNNQLLVFCLYTEAISKQFISLNFKNSETQEVVLLTPEDKLCFPLHDEVKKDYFSSLYQTPKRKM